MMAVPWLHYLLLFTATVSLLQAFLLFWVMRQGKVQPETGWLACLAVCYGIVSFYALAFLDISTLEAFRANQFARVMVAHVGLLLLLGYFEMYLSSWNTWIFKGMALLLMLPWLYAVTGHAVETSVEMARMTLPWGENITVFKAVYHPLAWLRNGIPVLLFFVALARCLWQIVHRREVWRHVLLALAVLNPIAVAVANVLFMTEWSIPMSPWGYLFFGLIMMLPVLNEVTSSRRLSLEIASREAQLRFMASQVPGVLYSLLVEPNGNRRFLFLSERVMDVLGFPVDHPHPLQAFAQGLTPEDQERYAQSEALAMRTLQPWDFIAQFTRPDGTLLWFQGFSHVSRNAQGYLSNGVIMDISDRVHQERELKKLLKEVTLRKDELEGLLFTLGHDLRSPLVNLDGFSYEAILLLEDAGHWNDEACQECRVYLQKLRDESQRMNELINTLLMLGRRSRDYLEIGAVDTGAVASELVARMPFADNGLRVEIAAGLPACRADVEQLRLVLAKVLENCIDYRKPAEEGVVRISAHQEGLRVFLEISDTGVGFAEQYAETIFRAFHQLNPVRNHQGVGLTVARLALLRMDGVIRVHSVVNQGTTVFVELPAGNADIDVLVQGSGHE